MAEQRKRGAAAPAPSRERPRATAPARPGRPTYPDAWAVLREPRWRQLVRSAVRAAAAGGAVALSTAASGCAEPPVCTADRMGELSAHGGQAAQAALDLRVASAVEQLGVGAGLVPHPASFMMAGEMPAPMPTLVPTPPAGGDVDPGPEEPAGAPDDPAQL